MLPISDEYEREGGRDAIHYRDEEEEEKEEEGGGVSGQLTLE